MKILKVVAPLLLVAAGVLAYAQGSQPNAASAPDSDKAAVSNDALKVLVEKKLGDGAKVDSVTPTNFSGLYEVRAGGDIMYTDAQAKYLVIGHVIDMETRKDYTKERLDEANKIKFSDLPLDSAVKMVKGNGKRVIAVFEDPNCHYCKNLRHTLASVDNVTVYTFMFNILAPDSFVKSKNVWCAPDRAKAWDDWMLNGKMPASASASCVSNPNDKILALGQKLHVTGTPTIFFADGTRAPGALDAPALEEKWASIH